VTQDNTAENERAATFGRDEAVELSLAFTRRLTGVNIADVVRLMAVTFFGVFAFETRFGVFAFETRLRDRVGSSALDLPSVILSPMIDKWSAANNEVARRRSNQ
jgi:hypothetical protein